MKVSDSKIDTEPSSPSQQQITFILEIVQDDLSDADPALIDAVGRDTANALRNDGYLVEPVYTGQRGGFLVDVITAITPIATQVWVNKDIILADMGALVTILSAAVPLARFVRTAYEKRVGKDIAQQKPIKITFDIYGTPIQIEVADMESAEGILKLAQRIQANHPVVASKVTTQTKIKVKGSLPKSPTRKRR